MASAEDLRALVGAILDSIFFEADLRERWAFRALAWLLEAESPHLAGRSHQVLLLCVDHAEKTNTGQQLCVP